MAAPSTLTKTEFLALVDKNLETLLGTIGNVTIGSTGEIISRQDALKVLVKRTLRKATQSRLRAEMATTPPSGLGA
jgi:hypothetical protein